MGRYFSQVLILASLLLILDNSCVCFCRNSTAFCREQEREALLQLLQRLRDPYCLLSSWKGQDCCKWEGVTCDREYGHVIQLQLSQPVRDEIDTDIYFPMDRQLFLVGELNSSLLHLRYLNHLDLSEINFHHQRIPEFLGSMKQLRYLNLSFANFKGAVPRQLGNLSKLEVLDLRHSPENLVVDDTLWVSQLRSLKYLDMSGSKIAEARGLMQVISTLPSLSHLSLSACKLQNFHLSSSHSANSTSFVHLQYLDLSSNFLQGPIPRTIVQNMTSLQHLDLSLNSFNSTIPMWFDTFASLVHLNLERNYFDCIEGGLFLFLKNKRYLKSLLLGYNQIQGEISTTQGNSSGLIGNNLEILNICGNYLEGALPKWLVYFTNLKSILFWDNFFSGPIPSFNGSLSNLETLDLPNNPFDGSIPSWLGWSSSLRSLDLSDNQLVGHIPESVWELRALQNLDLYGNRLEGVISEIHFSNLTRLKYFHISGGNNLTFEPKPSWTPPFQLKLIDMDSCRLGTTFPQWIRTQVEAEVIVLSNASLFGPLPKWLANLTTLDELYLFDNHFTGPLPNISSHCSVLDLSDNLISGSLPTNIGVKYQFQTLRLTGNLINGTIPSSLCDLELDDLNLASNELSGSIPDCWKGDLSFYTLSFNKLSGVVPSSIGTLSRLSALQLDGNRLNGVLPRALGNCTHLRILDLGENNFSGSIPTWLDGSFQHLVILRLRENRFIGSIPPQLCSLVGLQILDLAMNNLMGTIPRCLGHMSSMITSSPSVSPLPAKVKDYRGSWAQQHVVELIKGRYNDYTKIDLELVVNLDLSGNYLTGSIPEELTLLSKLQGLNLSHNYLSRDIPIGIGNMRSLESLDLSNNSLSGTIPLGIAALTYLAHLNLSQNNFTGQIPKGNQIQTLDDPSIYVGNPLLCGDLLRRKCLGVEAPQAPKISHLENTHEEDKLEEALFYVVVMLGLAIGFWGFFGVLQFKKDWRCAYFSFVDQAIDKAYVAIVVKVAKLQRVRQYRST